MSWRSLGRFLLLMLAVLAALRLLHLAMPIFYPEVLAGPFSLDGFEEVERFSGFSPLRPFYRPERLGARPVNITARRRPPSVVIYWQGERYLRLGERLGGERPPVPAEARPLAADLPAAAEAVWWREGWAYHVVGRSGDVWVELRTDLELEEATRVFETLRPHSELR